jgi:sugar lactone lactonase YvrE
MDLSTRLAALALATLSLGLGGCSGMQEASFPAVSAQNPVGALRGSVFGGHASIEGSHLFVLEATASGTASTGYAAKAKSLLTSSSTATSGTYPVAEDQTAGSVTNGLYYVTTDATGSFYITGDYTCDIGDPVYLYASGGSVGSNAVLSITAISETASPGTYTYSFTANNLLYIGQTVQFSASGLSGKWATLNGTTQTVLATPTMTSFQISTNIAPGSGANTQTGSVTATGAANPAIVNLAMLGVCPSSENFSTGPGALRYVYLNEVSTTAMAYAMAPFASDSLHIGSSATNLTGLQNAAINAANLYNIQGAPLELVGNSSAGEGQIANQATMAGNGTVPQAELDTIANILAACVDSANTAATASAACRMLFADATSNGTSSGVKPIDIASAAINMAHSPGAENVVELWELPSGAVPFAPQLTSQPKDFTVAITYSNLAAPGSIAIDASGNACVPTNSSSGYVTKLSPMGAVLATSATGGNGFNSIAIDPSGNVFVTAGNSNAVYKYNSSLNSVTGSPWTTPQMNDPTSVAIDSNGYVYVTDGGNSASIVRKFNNSGSLNASITNNCLTRVTQIAIDPSDSLWAAINSSNAVCRVSNPRGSATFSISGQTSAPTNVAIDSNGNGWAGAGAQTNLFMFTPTGRQSSFGVIDNNTQGGLSSPTWVAIDGGDNVWITNAGNSYALSEFNNAGTAITGSSGYQSGNLDNPSFVAIDPSGDVWVPNQGANSVTEIIGVAAPTVTPLSALQPGVEP